MKILIVINSLKNGGAERVASLLANKFSETEQVFIVTRDSEKDYFYTLKNNIVKIQISSHSRNSSLKYILRLTREILKIKPDILISFMTETNILSVLGARFAKILNPLLKLKIVISERIDPREHNVRKSIKILRRITYPLASELVIQTDNIKAWASSVISNKKIKVIPNPINFETICTLTEQSFRPHHRKYILCIGRLTQQKGHDLAIDAFHVIAEKLSDIDLIIIGEGPLKEQLTEKVLEYSLQERVLFIGSKKNIFDYLTHATLFILSSRYEGFPNVLAEALVLGTPSISFNCNSGPSDLLQGEMKKFLVGEISSLPLAKKMEEVLTMQDIQSIFQQYSKEIKTKLDISTVSSLWLK